MHTDDLARLQMTDLHPSDQGLSVDLSRSKTDQHGTGTTIGIAAPSSKASTGEGSEDSTLLDAGAAWTRWLRVGAPRCTDRTRWLNRCDDTV
ncbi:hypothetical protein [Actinomycetospora soli]|uniref:hypothetical protein n=1 Tax=Actinomycetospora soli TaxID=2893887 RepID=UPI001E59B0BA|nr:hypothetical protein [Actinomycetospora soli]MCD2191748.1 hypothetical protein [Actinomycetospora soli]